MRFVIVESPYGAESEEDVRRNINYLRACLRDCLLRGEAPFASHGLYTQPGVLDDDAPAEREHGIEAGLEIAYRADATVVYQDLGISRGMAYGIEHAKRAGRPVELRELGSWDSDPERKGW